MMKKIEGSKKRGKPNLRWTGSIKEAMHESTEAEQGC